MLSLLTFGVWYFQPKCIAHFLSPIVLYLFTSRPWREAVRVSNRRQQAPKLKKILILSFLEFELINFLLVCVHGHLRLIISTFEGLVMKISIQ